MTRIACGYCGRARPRTAPAKRPQAVTSSGRPISHAFYVWDPGQEACCGATTSMPVGDGCLRVRPRVRARLVTVAQAAAKAAQKEGTMLKKGELTIGGTVKREGGGRWAARLDVVMEGCPGPVIHAVAEASNPHRATSLAVAQAVAIARVRRKAGVA